MKRALCLLGRHDWLYNPEMTKRTCMRFHCGYGKARLGCWHFWRRWSTMPQLYTNACRQCRAKFYRSRPRAPLTHRTW